MWTGKEQAAVFALVCILAWVQWATADVCDTTDVDDLDLTAAGLSGDLYKELENNYIAQGNIGRLGYNLDPSQENGQQQLAITKYLAIGVIRLLPTTLTCRVIENYCSYTTSDHKFYVIAHNDKYVVLYTLPRQTLVIYTRTYGQASTQVDKLPQPIRNAIEEKCGKEATTSSFYTKRFNRWDENETYADWL